MHMWMFVLWCLLVTFSMLGLAYIINVLSMKEPGGTKLTGKILSWIIAAATVIILGLGIFSGKMTGYGMGTDKDIMMGKGPSTEMKKMILIRLTPRPENENNNDDYDE